MPTSQPFLHAYVLWHADAAVRPDCREMATTLFTLLSWNAVRPFAREIGIPTFFRTRPDGWPHPGPVGIDLDAAAHTIIFALVERRFVLDQAWTVALTGLQERVDASKGRHRLIVVAVEDCALQLPDAITARLAIQLFGQPAARQMQELRLQAASQICRVIEGHAPDAPTGVTLFVSHTKRDPRSHTLARKIRKLLAHEGRPTRYFFDTVDIKAGDDIERKIETAIAGSTLLVVRSDGYGASPWCHLEVLAAKRLQRPIIVLDALEHRDDRSLPGMGNVPCLRIDPSLKKKKLRRRLRDAVEAAVVESMRFLHARGRLTHLSAMERLPNNAIPYARPPEDRDLRRLNGKGLRTIVYPDPPLPRCELTDLRHHRTRLVTPLTCGKQNLAGRVIGLSLSTPTSGLDGIGLSDKHLLAGTELIARALLSKGATLAYGGGLQSAGITEFLTGLVRAHNASQRDQYKRILNYLPWPKTLAVDDGRLAKQSKHLHVIPVPPPQDLTDAGLIDPQAAPDTGTPVGAYALARGMLAMRQRMTADVDARIVMGGKLTGFSGRYPGILEEVLLALQAAKPVYVLGGFGGAAQAVAELLRGETPSQLDPAAIVRHPAYAAMMRFHNDDVENRKLPLSPIDWDATITTIQSAAGRDLAGLNNGLTTDENIALLRMQDIDEAIWLVLLGMSRR